MSFERSLVATKFSPPRPGAHQVARRQLLQTLHSGRHCKLTLVAGSAGFGKTELMTQWRRELERQGLKVAWLSLSADERALPTFETHLCAALANLGLNVGEDASAAAVINELAARDEDLFLILDDYHHVDDPAAHALVQKLIELSPGNLHLAIASRVAPPLNIARLRVMGQVSEIACDDLLFDLTETGAFLAQSLQSGAALTFDEIERIHDLTTGWPACLRLVSITLKGRTDRRDALGDLGWLQTYISENFLSRLPAGMIEFMESISICGRFNAELAAAVTGAADAGALLQRIEAENLLIARAEPDDRSAWFRFHPLFAEYLTARLERRGADAVAQLHLRACAWYAKKGPAAEAIRHACLANDLEAAVAMFAEAAQTAWALKHFGPALIAPFQATSDQALRERFVSTYFHAHPLIWEGRYAEAYELLAPVAPEKRNEPLAIITDRTEFIWLLREGRVAEAERAGASVYARAVAAHGRRSLTADLCAAPLVAILFELNRVEEARTLLAPRQHMLTGAPSFLMISLTLCKARMELLQGDEESALELLEAQADLFGSIGLTGGVTHVLGEVVAIHVAAGRRALAADALARMLRVDARRELHADRADIAAETELAKARLLAMDGAHDSALEALAAARGLSRRLGLRRLRVITEIVAARVLKGAGRQDEAAMLLAAAVERAARLGLVRTIIRWGTDLDDLFAHLQADGRLTPEAGAHLGAVRSAGAAPTPARSLEPAHATVTPRQVQILSLAATGMSNKRIALALNISSETVKWNLRDVYAKLGVSSRYDATTWARRHGIIG
jgi:LuxR family maltose regulon positive regulatory protein